jgi:lysophospholipase L1-like esterase
MRQRRLLAVLTAGAVTAAAVLLTAGAANAAGANYVALGDSYSSGLGAGSYGSSGSCSRSSNAYAQLWANAHAPSSFIFAACSGATTSDVVNNQVSSLSSATTLASITIGGNDVGFASVMQTCVLGSTNDCLNAVNAAEAKVSSQLPAELDNALNAIRAHAPNARVVVLDYPEIYDLSKSSTCIGLSTTDRVALNGAADQLDAAVQAAAARHGDVFAEVRSAFSGHEICDSSSWLHSVDWFNIGDSYHPTAPGQSGAYYPVFAANAS